MTQFPTSTTVPAGLSVALYKGTRPGLDGLYNRVGRMLDRGPYSHCEMVFSNGISASSSFLDHGVRIKGIGYSSIGHWDFMPIADPSGAMEAAAWAWFYSHMGAPYDVLGNIRFAFGFARDSFDKWFCSEAVMAALGYDEPWRYGPSGAATALKHDFKTKMIEVPPNGN